MTILKDITAKYTFLDSLIYDYFIAPAAHTAFFKKVYPLKIEAKYKSLNNFSKIIDIGCGGGQILIDLALRFPELRFTGIDFSEDQINRANLRLKQLHKSGVKLENIEFLVGNAVDLTFDDNLFDSILCIACLKHWTDKVKGLIECRRILKDSGSMHFIEIDKECTKEDLKRFVNFWRLPKFLLNFAQYFFKTFVADKSLDESELRFIFDTAGVKPRILEHFPESPAFYIEV